MDELRTIEIDFEIHQKIEKERRGFSEPSYKALRRLLNLPEKSQPKAPAAVIGRQRSWLGEGVTLPHGSQLRMTYNGRLYSGEISDGKWVVEGREFESPSGAASGNAITKRGRTTRLDGWIYWEVRFPDETNWKRISALRASASARVPTAADL